jgi:hypothetical protein
MNRARGEALYLLTTEIAEPEQMQIIVRKAGTEVERRKQESAQQILRHYYQREIRDGARFRTKSGATKEVIRKLYAVR